MTRAGDVAGHGAGAGSSLYRLRLFVAGDEPNSVRGRATLRRLCQSQLHGECEIEIIDVFQDYQAAIDHGVVAVPTLVVESPPPTRTIVGSLDDEAVVIAALGLRVEERIDG